MSAIGPGVARAVTGTWIWALPADVSATVGFLTHHQVASVFVAVGLDGPGPGHASLAPELRRAGIRCEALGGDASWVRNPELAVQWAARALRPGLFDGLHVDVEPWTLPEWPRQSAVLLAGLADVVRRISTIAPVDVDLPGWLAHDHAQATDAIVRAAQRVTILAYRDRATAIEQASAAALAVGERAGRRCRVAVDTLPSEQPQTTFADDTGGVLVRELAAVHTRLAGRPGYDGMAVHDLDGWRKLVG